MKHCHVRRIRSLLPILAVMAMLLALGAESALAQAEAAQAETARATKSASRYSATIRDGRTAARTLLSTTDAPSLSLALIADGRVVWRQGFGVADKAAGTRPAPTTMYGIGSVSKMVATVAAMQLVDQGLVSLDEPFATYVPSFRMRCAGYRDITVRMLLDHSSGFPGSVYGSALSRSYWSGYPQYVMDVLAASRLKHTPGFLSTYCNDGFTMVEELVPAVTGKSFTQYVQDEIFAPLGMSHSAYPLQPFADGSYAKAYDGDTPRPREVLNVLASGGLYSTPTDMGRLATMLANNGVFNGTRILSSASVAEMGVDQTRRSFDPAPSNSTRYGLGWDSVTEPGLKAVRVTGWVKGGDSIDYHAGFTVVPKYDLAAIVTAVAPVNSTDCETLAQRILLHALVDRGALRRMPAQVKAAAPRVKRAGRAQLAAMKGYWAGSGTAFRITRAQSDPQSLTLSALGDGEWVTRLTRLRLRTDGRFHVKGSPNSLRTVTGAGRRYLVNRKVGGYGHYRDDLLLAQKLTPGEPLSAAWRQRVGMHWLAVNERWDSATYTDSGGALLSVGEIPGMDGYITVTTGGYGTQVVRPDAAGEAALMFLQIPGFGSRDLNDAIVEQYGGEDFMRYSSSLYRPLAGVPALAVGANVVTVGPEGYTEWRSLAAAASVTVDAGIAWYAYDEDLSILGSGSSFPAAADLPAGAYLAVIGPAGSTSTVTVGALAGSPLRASPVAARAAPVLPGPSAVPALR